MKLYLAGQSQTYRWVKLVAKIITEQFSEIEFTEPWWESITPWKDHQYLWEFQRILNHHADRDREGVRDADLVLAVLFPGVHTAGAWWELGLAEGLKKPFSVLVLSDSLGTGNSFFPAQEFRQIFLCGVEIAIVVDEWFEASRVKTLQEELILSGPALRRPTLGGPKYREFRQHLATILKPVLKKILRPPAGQEITVQPSGWTIDPFPAFTQENRLE